MIGGVAVIGGIEVEARISLKSYQVNATCPSTTNSLAHFSQHLSNRQERAGLGL